MEVKPGYTKTEVGVIPEEWGCSTVRGIAAKTRNAIVGGPFGSDLVSNDYVEHGVPVIRGQNMSGQWVSGNFVFVTPAKAKSLEANLARPGDIVFTQRGTLGQVSLVPDQPFASYLVSQSQMKLSVNRQVANPLYFFYVFTSEDQQELIRGGTIQTGVPHINLGILRDIPLQLPPLPEQRAIAEVLGDVDALLGSLEKLIAKKRDLKQAAMQQLLTGKKRLPGFSGEWEVKRLGDVAALHRINVVPVSFPNQMFIHFSLPAFDAGRIPVIEPGSAIGSNKFRVPQGAVLVSKLNPRIPRAWAPDTIPSESIASTEFLVLTPKEEMSRLFLFVLCSSALFCEQMELAATGTTGSHQRISPSGALTLKVSVPVEVEEQTAIAEVLSDMDTELAALEQRLAKTRDLKQGMMQELLTGKTRLV
jgi:type I restriction enzyme S subunit